MERGFICCISSVVSLFSLFILGFFRIIFGLVLGVVVVLCVVMGFCGVERGVEVF